MQHRKRIAAETRVERSVRHQPHRAKTEAGCVLLLRADIGGDEAMSGEENFIVRQNFHLRGKISFFPQMDALRPARPESSIERAVRSEFL